MVHQETDVMDGRGSEGDRGRGEGVTVELRKM